MRHQKSGRKFSRTSAHRQAMFRNMVTSLLRHGGIRTTVPKAKELRKLADRMVTLGKTNTLHARRLVARTVQDREVLGLLFDEIAPGFAERQGGYTRIIKLGTRKGDNAEMGLIELMPAGAPEARSSRGARPTAPRVRPAVATPETKESFAPSGSEAEDTEG